MGRAAPWLVALATAGCGGASVPGQPPGPAAPSDACLLPTGDPAGSGDVVVAPLHPADSALVARQRVEPLVRLDCTGSPRPAAAEAWTPDSSRRSWIVTLSPAAFGLTAGSLAAEWRSRPEAATTVRESGVVSLVPLDERRLVVTLDRPADSLPPFFADPSLGVVLDTLAPRGTRLVLGRSAGPDPRDALDAGADLVRTADPALLDYARSRADLLVHPLPWSRTYVLLVPSSGGGLGSAVPADTGAFRADLARDAVPADARPAEPPFWWDGLACGAPGSPPSPSSEAASAAVVYPREDPVARALAERLVALSDRPGVLARGLSPAALADALRAGRERAYVLALPRTALVPCREMTAWPSRSAVVPLIETRAVAIARRGIPRLTVEYDGGLRPAEAP
jgi:hypothetical protein